MGVRFSNYIVKYVCCIIMSNKVLVFLKHFYINVFLGGRFLPIMDSLTEGVTSLKLVARSDCPESPSGSRMSPRPSVWEHNLDDIQTEVSVDSQQEEELLGSQVDAGTRTSVIIELKGDLDVVISPLLLETLQKYIDTLTPTLANLHPSAVINHLHASCISQVVAANVLKTPENIPQQLQNQKGSLTEPVAYEETIKSQLQAAFKLPKVCTRFESRFCARAWFYIYKKATADIVKKVLALSAFHPTVCVY